MPRLKGGTADEIASEALRLNARDVLWAGAGHFRYLWVSDFGKALAGASRALPAAYLRGQLELMIGFSRREGRVTSCFDARGGFDMPYYRADGLPWLIIALSEYERLTADASLRREHSAALQDLIDVYERTHFRDGLIDAAQTGDWMDTVLRPSSTYNNVCALAMLRRAPALGLRTAHDPDEMARRLLEDRLRAGFLTDYAGTERESVDAPVYALYLEVFDRPLRERLAARLEAGGWTRPIPILSAAERYDRRLMPLLTRFSPDYHSTIWLHLGFMYLNGLRRLGQDVGERRRALAELIVRHGNIVETLAPSGELYSAAGHATEHGLTMAAGQWLELSA